MSLIYDESDIAEKDEEINLEKIVQDDKEKNEHPKNKNNQKKEAKERNEEVEDYILAHEALMNIPTKSISLKKKI
jgi:hypothetical protein